MSKTREEMRAYISQGPTPLSGPPLYERGLSGEDLYNAGGTSLAKAMLILCDEQPSLLSAGEKAFDLAMDTRWPDWDGWIGGVTIFMWGWARGAVRYINGVTPPPNPAIREL